MAVVAVAFAVVVVMPGGAELADATLADATLAEVIVG